jgi:hypothetical protein
MKYPLSPFPSNIPSPDDLWGNYNIPHWSEYENFRFAFDLRTYALFIFFSSQNAASTLISCIGKILKKAKETETDYDSIRKELNSEEIKECLEKDPTMVEAHIFAALINSENGNNKAAEQNL